MRKKAWYSEISDVCQDYKVEENSILSLQNAFIEINLLKPEEHILEMCDK